MFASTTGPTVIVWAVDFDQTGANGLPGCVKIRLSESHVIQPANYLIPERLQ